MGVANSGSVGRGKPFDLDYRALCEDAALPAFSTIGGGIGGRRRLSPPLRGSKLTFGRFD